MFSRTRVFIRGRISQFALRVKCWNLPPVATHLACFLMGTLLFQPDPKGRVPQGIHLPWTTQRLEGSPSRTSDYRVIARKKRCLLAEESVRLWIPEEKKLYVVIEKGKDGAPLTHALLKPEAFLIVKNDQSLPSCEATHATIYP